MPSSAQALLSLSLLLLRHQMFQIWHYQAHPVWCQSICRLYQCFISDFRFFLNGLVVSMNPWTKTTRRPYVHHFLFHSCLICRTPLWKTDSILHHNHHCHHESVTSIRTGIWCRIRIRIVDRDSCSTRSSVAIPCWMMIYSVMMVACKWIVIRKYKESAIEVPSIACLEYGFTVSEKVNTRQGLTV